MKASHREAMRLDELHEQAQAGPLPHDELVHLQRCAQEARVTADQAGHGDALAPPYAGRLRRPSVFSNAAVQFCLSIKVLFKLPLRQKTGMVMSLLSLVGLDWPAPDYSTLCRRQKTLKMQIPYPQRMVGSTGRTAIQKLRSNGCFWPNTSNLTSPSQGAESRLMAAQHSERNNFGILVIRAARSD